MSPVGRHIIGSHNVGLFVVTDLYGINIYGKGLTALRNTYIIGHVPWGKIALNEIDLLSY